MVDLDPHSTRMYDDIYRDSRQLGSTAAAIWHIDDAQPRVKELAALGALRGEIADVGCGLGSSVIYLARQGYSVTGLDSSPVGIAQARARAAAESVNVTFEVADARELDGFSGAFDTVFETGTFHCLDPEGQRGYAAAVHRATRPGAHWFIFCFATHTVNGIRSPLGVPSEDIRTALGDNGWVIDYFGSTVYQFEAQALGQLPVGHEGWPADMADHAADLRRRVDTVLPLLDPGEPLYMPVWAVYASRR